MLAAAIIAMAMLPRSSGVHPQSDPAIALITRADALIAHGDFDAAARAADAAAGPTTPALRAAAEEIQGAVAEARDAHVAAVRHHRRALEWAEVSHDSPLIARDSNGWPWMRTATTGFWRSRTACSERVRPTIRTAL